MQFIKRHKKKFIAGVVILFILMLSGDNKEPSNPSTSNSTSNTNTNTVTYTTPAESLTITNPIARGNRMLGMGISEGSVGFNVALAKAQETKAQALELGTSWGESEKTPGQIETPWLSIANQFYPGVGMRVSIGLNPIDTSVLQLPSDLKGKSFNDPEVIARYKKFVDHVAVTMKDTNVYTVAIGNEIDSYLGTSDKRWQEYSDFFSQVAPYVKSKFPNAIVGSKIVVEGLLNQSDKASSIINNSDAILTSYYPFNPGFSFTMRPPTTVHEDFKRLVELYPNKKIYFMEIGYPSSELNDSSEAIQAQFVHESFIVWDKYRNNIPFLNFQWLHDQPPQRVKEWEKYYGSSDKRFVAYLSTLGLRTYDGKDKLSYIQLKKEVTARGW